MQLGQALQALHDIHDPPSEDPPGAPATPRLASEALAAATATTAASEAAILLKQLRKEEQGINEKLAELDALQPYEQVCCRAVLCCAAPMKHAMNDLGWTRKWCATPQILISLLNRETQM